LNHTARTRDFHRLYVLNCKEDSYRFSMSYYAVNPGGEFLSLSQVPYKTLYLWAAYGWSLLTVLWACNLFRYRHWNIKVQRPMLLVPLTQIAASVAQLYFWRQASKTGRYPKDLLAARNILTAFAQGMLFLNALLIARGWGILRAHIE